MTLAFQSLEQKNSYLSIHLLLPTTFVMPPSLLSVTPEEMDSILQIASKVFQIQETNIQDSLTEKILDKRLEVIQSKHQRELLDIRNELEQKHSRELSDLRRSLAENEGVLRNEKRSLELAFEKENKELRFKLTDLEASLRAARTLYDQIQSHAQQDSERRVQEVKDLYEKMLAKQEASILQKEAKLQETESALQQRIISQTNSTKRGEAGESDFLELVNQYTEWNLVHTGKAEHHCDYSAHIHNLGVFFEVKNYTTDVPTKEVNKFIRDLKEHKEIHAGIFVSLQKRITGKTSGNDNSNLYLDWTADNQLCIYISNFLSLDIPFVFFFIDKVLSILQTYNKQLAAIRTEEYEQVATLQSRIDLVKNYIENTINRVNAVLHRMGIDKKQMIDRINENYMYYVNELKQQVLENETAIHILLGKSDPLESIPQPSTTPENLPVVAEKKTGGRKKAKPNSLPSQ